MKTPLQQLAEYFTGTEVGKHSIGLSVPDGPMRLRQSAENFFKVRSALGIDGYANEEEAEKAILKALKP